MRRGLAGAAWFEAQGRRDASLGRGMAHMLREDRRMWQAALPAWALMAYRYGFASQFVPGHPIHDDLRQAGVLTR